MAPPNCYLAYSSMRRELQARLHGRRKDGTARAQVFGVIPCNQCGVAFCVPRTGTAWARSIASSKLVCIGGALAPRKMAPALVNGELNNFLRTSIMVGG